MNSPFPGMDPYLEDRSLWPDFHARLITYISEQLQPQIRPAYSARIEERIHLIRPPQVYYPDVTVVRRPERATVPAGATLVADEPVVIEALESELREPYIEIVHLASGEVVTTIKLLSPVNKSGEGRDRYRQKQQVILETAISLVEIDLLRAGEHTIAAAEASVRAVAGRRYIVSVRRGGRSRRFEVYFAALDSRLPRPAIPLREPDDDAVLDLPAVFDRTYDVSGYEDFVDYRKPPPPPPLDEEEAAWLEALLQEKGLRAVEKEE